MLVSPKVTFTSKMLEQDIQPYGIGHYAARIRSGQPFTLVRYGEGEWKNITPDIPPKHPRNVWATPASINDLRESIIHAPEDDNYLVGIWHIAHLKEIGAWPKVLAWLDTNAPPGVRWVNGRVFRAAVEKAILFPFVKAIRQCSLPIVLVGPQRIHTFSRRIAPVARHIVIPPNECYPHKARVLRQVREFGKPAMILFSASGLTKMVAWQLWEDVGQQSFMIDCGAMWDVMLGYHSRTFHRTITKEKRRKCLRGK
jgi:hypothetical protein